MAMGNTREQIALAKQAFGLIHAKYGTWLDPVMLQQFHAANTDHLFRFMASGPFNTNLMLSDKPKTGCTTHAFVSRDDDDPVIWINADIVKPPTLVHELLHYFTHPRFRAAVTPELNEAVTEYFTRKLVNLAYIVSGAAVEKLIKALVDTGEFGDLQDDPKIVSGLQLDKFARRQAGVYEQEHQKFVNATKLGKQFDPAWAQRPDPNKKPGVVKRAYFKGDPVAIQLLKDAFF
jgi:hypothetical protein